MDVIFLVNIFCLYLKVKSNFFHNSIRQNLFLSACYYWEGTISLREVDQKFLHGGKIGYGDSYLDSVFRYFKVFRLYAILHDAAGAVRLQTGKGPGYCYMIGRDLNSCFAWSREWTIILSLRKNLSTLHFQVDRLLNQYVFDCIRYRANWEKHK